MGAYDDGYQAGYHGQMGECLADPDADAQYQAGYQAGQADAVNSGPAWEQGHELPPAGQHGGEHGEDPHIEIPEYEITEPPPPFPTLVGD